MYTSQTPSYIATYSQRMFILISDDHELTDDSDEYDVMLIIKLLEFLITLIIAASCSCELACTLIANL